MKIYIISVDLQTAKNQSSYYRVRYRDEKKLELASVYFEPYSVPPETLLGKVVDAEVKEGNPSSKIVSATIAENQDVSPFIRVTAYDVAQMVADLKVATRGEGVDPDLTKIVDDVLFDVPARLERFSTWPAAAVHHHAFKGGLLEHTWGMYKVAKAIAETDPAHKGVKLGVVSTSITLHDIGKILSYAMGAGGGYESTTQDLLLGHISMGDELVVRSCAKLGIASQRGNVLNMRHCILSHHGKKEWGSPIFPATPEAILVHQVDMIQSRGEMATEALELVEPGVKTAYVKTLDSYLIRI